MPSKKGFWSGLPGQLTALAVLITAVTGFIIAVRSGDDQGVVQDSPPITLGDQDEDENDPAVEPPSPQPDPEMTARLVAEILGAGSRLWHQDKYTEAIAKYNEALQEDPDNAEAHRRLGIAHELLGTSRSDAEHLRLALGHFQEANTIEPGSETARIAAIRQKLIALATPPGDFDLDGG